MHLKKPSPWSGGRVSFEARQTIDSRDTGTTQSLGAWIRFRAGERRYFLRPDSATSSAITKLMAISGWIPQKIAHQIGLKSNATMLYGHVENDEGPR